MKINNSFIRIALAVGLVGLAACGGSDSSSNRDRNAAIATNVQQYNGQISFEFDDRRSNKRNAPLQTFDEFSFSFDENLDAIDTNSSLPSYEKINTCAVSPDWIYTVCPETIPPEDDDHRTHVLERSSLENDFRTVFSNLTLSSAANNRGTLDLRNVQWAKCPLIANFGTNTRNAVPTTANSFTLVFAEAPNDEVATSDCNAIPVDASEEDKSSNFYSADGKATPVKGLKLELSFRSVKSVFPDNAQPKFSDVLADGLQQLVKGAVTARLIGERLELSRRRGGYWSLDRLTSAKVLDYAPYAAIATAETGAIKVSWTQSADLNQDSEVSYVVEVSKDGFTDSDNIQSIGIGNNLTFSHANCEINPNNDVSVDTEISYRVFAIRPDGVSSKATDVVSVKKTAENILCPEGSLAAPTNVQAKFLPSDEVFSVSWDAPSDASQSEILYCVLASGDNFSSESVETYCEQIEKNAKLELRIPFYFASSTFKVYGTRFENGVTSALSESSPEVRLPVIAPVTNVKASLLPDGLKVSWTPGIQVAGLKAQSVDLAWGFITSEGRGPLVNSGGTTSSIFVIPNSDLTEGFGPGAKVWIDVASGSNLGFSEIASGSFEYPSGQETVVSGTGTPVVEETAKSAIVTETATEVQLPAAAVEVAVNVEDVYTGFGVTASDVKSIEYQIDAGSWTAVTPGAALKIPNAASKMAVRVTKTNGETVVSEKVIVRTEETTETTVGASDSTMAPADTTAPVTTEAPASSESSSSNNILLYILVLVVLAAIAGFFFKKKSASTN
jgi:hypothetical protein